MVEEKQRCTSPVTDCSVAHSGSEFLKLLPSQSPPPPLILFLLLLLSNNNNNNLG
jgi:hypothetical protein